MHTLLFALALIQSTSDDPAQTRRDLAEARSEADSARRRAEKLEAAAATASAAADKTAQATAALAARIQQAEAEIAADEVRIAIIERQRTDLRARLAQRQRPLVELTGALQRLSRRPPVASLLRPGSLRDTVHSRALLETLLPEVQRRTAALRVEIAHAHDLQQQARGARLALQGEIRTLDARRRQLAGLETTQRLAARDANGSADREAERALALAEKARDLGGLVDGLEQAALLREKLARLPGPVLRSGAGDPAPEPETPQASARLAGFTLPVAGRLVSGFGDASRGSPAHGIGVAVRGQAQVVAPAAGRVAFADAYAGYGLIVIIDHPGGWTSLVTGLGTLAVRVGDMLLAGSPIGTAAPETRGGGRPVLTLELRKDGQPVNPLDQLRG